MFIFLKDIMSLSASRGGMTFSWNFRGKDPPPPHPICLIGQKFFLQNIYRFPLFFLWYYIFYAEQGTFFPSSVPWSWRSTVPGSNGQLYTRLIQLSLKVTEGIYLLYDYISTVINWSALENRNKRTINITCFCYNICITHLYNCIS